MTILIAEDDALTRRGLTEIFSSEGWKVLAVGDGEAAINAFHQAKPDAVCLDIMMPKRSGYDVCREIRKHDPHIPLLFLSAKSEEIDTQNLRRSSFSWTANCGCSLCLEREHARIRKVG